MIAGEIYCSTNVGDALLVGLVLVVHVAMVGTGVVHFVVLGIEVDTNA